MSCSLVAMEIGPATKIYGVPSKLPSYFVEGDTHLPSALGSA